MAVIQVTEKHGFMSTDYSVMCAEIKYQVESQTGLIWHVLLLVKGGSSLVHNQQGYVCLQYGPFQVTVYSH
jgi:hypothetical protein